jgi:hypoxanthine phosphoribosyltransferase
MNEIISELKIRDMVETLVWSIYKDYKDREPPVFLVVANAALLFASDLFKGIYDLSPDFMFYIDIVKPYSYGIESNVKQALNLNIGLNPIMIKHQSVIIVDTVYDTGNTVKTLMTECTALEAASIDICVLVAKNLKDPHPIKYLGGHLDTDKFLVGYGLDDKGLKRNMYSIYEAEN